jgi:uncharacterized protein (DUF1501 family)
VTRRELLRAGAAGLLGSSCARVWLEPGAPAATPSGALGSASARGRRRSRGGRGLEASVETLLALERSGIPVRAAMLESGGWDTHSGQGREQGQLAGRIGELARALQTLLDGAGQHRELVLFVLTEFGRTVRPNGAGGSDHGHGSVMLVAGPRVRAGVHGDWPGLEERALWEGRDLPVSVDYRSVLFEVLRAHLGQVPPVETFPGFDPQPVGVLG